MNRRLIFPELFAACAVRKRLELSALRVMPVAMVGFPKPADDADHDVHLSFELKVAER
jgi:hypothetical protein